MASLKDAQQLTKGLEDLVGQLQSELQNGNVDFEKLVSISDEISERADGIAETFTNVNDDADGADLSRRAAARPAARDGPARKEEAKSGSRGGDDG